MLNQVYDYALANDIIGKDYASYVNIGTPDDPKTVRTPFNNDEINYLWENLDRLDGVDTILIMIYTGWRIGEFLSLKNSHINFTDMTIKGGSKTQAGKNRIVPIYQRILPLIEQRYKDNDDTLLAGSVPYSTYLDRWDVMSCYNKVVTPLPKVV